VRKHLLTLFPIPKTLNVIEKHLVDDKKFDPPKSHLKYDGFDQRKHLTPNVLWFQPHNKSSQSIELSLAIAYQTICNKIDGYVNK
jgi:hypothetical protein